MRGFDDDERERIRADIQDAARDLFARYGLEKTTIADLTEPAGIATSTFYQFYDSKERLYYEVLREEGERLAEDIIVESFEAEVEDDPEAAIVTFLTLLCEAIETNPLVQRLLVDGDLERVVASLDDEEMRAEQADSLGYLTPYVERWQDQGDLRRGDPDVLAAAMGVVKFVAYHRDQFRDDDFYRAVRDELVEIVAAGMTATDGG